MITDWNVLFGDEGKFKYTEFEKYFNEIKKVVNDMLSSISVGKTTYPIYMSGENYVLDESLLSDWVNIAQKEKINNIIKYRNELVQIDKLIDINEPPISDKIHREIKDTLNNLNEMFELPD
ncbi:hypothetical protein FACS189461_4440 [Spirochaetia bacterium]|nr:hypothetical protein FACS189461_4440 [Spirochaetia bacterium]